TLVRAATAPKTMDSERERALSWISGFDLSDLDHLVKIQGTIKAALQSPAAVPQEVVSLIEQEIVIVQNTIDKNIDGISDVSWQVALNRQIVRLKKALALLQQKGAE